ncbi:MAG: diguanylate cyclase [Porticoccaceae bacterium]|nr:sensor domain-containing diguanylate cyclase [Pseudomonadales bacterium]
MASDNVFSQQGKLSAPLLVSAITFCVLLIPATMLVNYLIHRYEHSIIEETSYRANALVAKLEGKIDANIAVGRGFDAHISALGGLSQDDLAALAERLIDPELNIRHVALAPDLIISAVYPLAGNEAALGLDYRKNLRQKQAALRAVNSGEIILAGPVELVQGGGEQLVARVPIHLASSDLWGLVAIVINFEELLADSGFYSLTAKYDLAMRGQDGLGALGATFMGKDVLFDQPAHIFDIQVPGGEWQLAIAPKLGWHAPMPVLIAYWVIALAICLLASFIVYFVRKQVIERVAYLRRLEELATIDPLTQLTSRFQLNKYISHLIDECERNDQGFSVLFIDLDHFKEVNDGLGHAMGDKVLVEIADTNGFESKRTSFIM